MNVIDRLEAEVKQETHPPKLAEIKCRLSIHYSRLGKFSEAEALIFDVRQSFGQGENPRVSVWIIFAEGILFSFRDASDAGVDRVMRAQLLAGSIRDRPLMAVTSAWRAHQQFEKSEFRGMARSLETALANSENADHDSLNRIYSVLANAYMSAGMKREANLCYSIAHHHAVKGGDRASIDALIYNKGAFSAAWLRVSACLGEIDQNWLRTVRGELRSSENFQSMLGSAAVNSWVRLWSARAAILSEDYEAAEKLLANVKGASPYPKTGYRAELIDLERSWCLLSIGKPDEAKALLDAIESFNFEGLHADERLVAASLLRLFNQHFSGHPALQKSDLNFDQCCVDFRSCVDEIRNELKALGDGHLRALPPGVQAQKS